MEQVVQSILDQKPQLKKLGVRLGPALLPASKQRILAMGWAGSGKTSAALSIPRCLLLDSERGGEDLLSVHESSARKPVNSWEELQAIMTWLEEDAKTHNRLFDMVAIDTYDMLAGNQISHLARHLMKDSKADLITMWGANGAGWSSLKELAASTIFRLVEAGYGLFITVHLQRKLFEDGGKMVNDVSAALTPKIFDFLRNMATVVCELDRGFNEVAVEKVLTGGERKITTKEKVEQFTCRFRDRTNANLNRVLKTRVPVGDDFVYEKGKWWDEFATRHAKGIEELRKQVPAALQTTLKE